MKPRDLYEMAPERVDNDITILKGAYYNHVPEISQDMCYQFPDEAVAANKRVEIRSVKHFDFDFRRFWKLATVWFDNRPVMVIQNAGREGDDHHARFVTDKVAYHDMITYLFSLLPIHPLDIDKDFRDIDEDIDGLDNFYGNRLMGYFDRCHC